MIIILMNKTTTGSNEYIVILLHVMIMSITKFIVLVLALVFTISITISIRIPVKDGI